MSSSAWGESHREIGGNHGHLHFVVQPRVPTGSEDDIGIGVCQVFDHSGRLLHFLERQIVASREYEQDATGAF